MKGIREFRLAMLLAGLTASSAQATHEITVDADPSVTGPVISKNIYGQFAEHLGYGIYEGLWVGKDSTIPNTEGFRSDVVGALKELHVPVIRWPGGCFADEYHWRDGIGPQKDRPVKVNTNWGGVEEDNQVGTHEIFTLTEMLGADMYLNINLGSGTVKEMADWVEYITADNNSTLAQERRKNGRDKPWSLPFIGIGNEAWGCGGHMSPEYYVDLYRQFGTFVKTSQKPYPTLVASGGTDGKSEWTDILSKKLGERTDAISFHYYTLPTGDWNDKGEATGFDSDMWFKTMDRTYKMKGYLEENLAFLEKNDPDNKIAFYVDEWGTWYNALEGTNPGFLIQQNSLRDAVITAVNLNLFHDHADRVKMTNIAQMVNVLQAMILTDEDKMLLTPTYHVFRMYRVFQDAVSVPAEVSEGEYRQGDVSLPATTVSVAKGEDGGVYVAMVNMDPEEASSVTLNIDGVKGGDLELLTANTMDAHNTFSKPELVKPVRVSFSGTTVKLPPKAVAVAKLKF
ncbi:alpha-N-arabinofuranosidase [Alteromonas confluentis]|uniref:non-reducing end alpha-L-arabinofuranosidase n=1 Tax=Alteromonas confluentis TaxID=1656094 RepID=A0A1E7Z9T7_9ALTE|nr:alpha-L-arabinofuranosidase C-terminal domain-containing protein [Alteromonas confluentis]OFC70295.1 alpha-N-arabinofuranosidase [Alteromonas confluentis]